MAGEIRFHEEAIAIFAVAQIAEGTSGVQSGLKQGTITAVLAATSIVGIGTKFLTELIIGDKLYDDSGSLLGTVTGITDDLNLAITAIQTAVGAGGDYTNHTARTSGAVTTNLASDQVVGVNTTFLTSVAPGSYLFTTDYLVIGRVLSVQDNLNLTLEDNVAAATGATATTMATKGAVAGVTFETGLGPKNATAVLNLNFTTELTSEAFTYVGDELSRDEETVITDKFAKSDFEVFLPSLNGRAATAGAVDEADVPLSDLMQASGFAVDLATNDTVKYTNSVASNEYLTIEIRRSSPGIATQKTYLTTDSQGLVDLDATIGTRAKLKFTFEGNLVKVTQKLKVPEDFGTQKVGFAPSFKSSTISLVELGLYDSATPPTLTGPSNACFDKLIAPNVAGFEYDRFLTGCVDGWSKGATPSDVTITIIEDEAYADYNPDDHLEELHGLVVKVGDTVGEKVQLDFLKVQLANVTNSTVAKFAGQDLAFRNVGKTNIILT